MSTAITSYTIGTDLEAYDDAIFRATALGNGAAVTSSAFRFHNTAGGVEIVITANTEITLAEDATIAFALTTSNAFAGSYAAFADLGTLTGASGGTTIAAGTILAKYIAPVEIQGTPWAKVSATTSGDQSADSINGYIKAVRLA